MCYHIIKLRDRDKEKSPFLNETGKFQELLKLHLANESITQFLKNVKSDISIFPNKK